jgi:hypothetical protein
MRRKLMVPAVVLAATLAGVAGASVAGAVPPERFTEEFEDQFTDTESCDFPINLHFVGSIDFTLFFDSAGNLVRVQGIGSDVGTATNPANGKTATGVDHWLQVEEVESGEFAILGLFFHLNFPGAGIVLIDAGNATFDAEGNLIHMSGPHQALEGDLSALCEALV